MANHPSFNQPPALSLVLIWVLFGTVSIQGQPLYMAAGNISRRKKLPANPHDGY